MSNRSLLQLAAGLLLAMMTLASAAAKSDADATTPAAGQPVSARTMSRLLITDVTRIGRRIVAVGEHGYIVYSDDQGEHWQRGSGTGEMMLTAVRFADAEHGWAVGHDGVIYASTDGGASWVEQRYMPDQEEPLLSLWFKDASTGIATGAYGLYLETHDGGKTWTERRIVDGDRHLNSITSFGDGKLAIAGEAGTLLISADGGQTWTPSPSPYPGSYFGVLRLPGEALLIFGLRGQVFRSDDAGQSWQPVKGSGSVTLLGGAALDDGLVVLVGSAGTVRVSRDGGHTFTAQPAELPTAFSATLPLDDSHILLFGEAGVNRLQLNSGSVGDGR